MTASPDPQIRLTLAKGHSKDPTESQDITTIRQTPMTRRKQVRRFTILAEINEFILKI